MADRLLVRRVVTESGCWVWQGSKLRGYGHISVQGQVQLAHRAAYEAFVGPIPDGLTIDHLCRNPSCINPEHLEPVTIAENVKRNFRSRITHCPRGHPYSGDNLYQRRARPGRACRTCARERMRANYIPRGAITQ